jgi:cytochrome c biogenesis protein CcmG/thiol:disulfide interchange protein DsbE|tara:strand:- start:15 stop:599 length:585 start_codon:yes stop_codon:yes gene_type:complete
MLNNKYFFLKTLSLILISLIFFACSQEIENNITSEFLISGEQISIADPQTRLDNSRGMNSPVVEFKIPEEDIYVTYPENTPTIFLFVAHWCPYCQEEIPEVINWIEDNDILNKGVNVVLIVTSTDSNKNNYPPDSWLYNVSWKYPVIYDDERNSLAGHFGVSYFPSWVFTESDGKIAFTHAGKIGLEELTQLIN